MKRIAIFIYFVFLVGCVQSQLKTSLDKNFHEVVFLYGFQQYEEKGKGENVFFVEVEGKEIENSLLEKLKKSGKRVEQIKNSNQSCEGGIFSIIGNEKGVAFRIFEVSDLVGGWKRVKLGYWRNCKEYNYEYISLRLSQNGWKVEK